MQSVFNKYFIIVYLPAIFILDIFSKRLLLTAPAILSCIKIIKLIFLMYILWSLLYNKSYKVLIYSIPLLLGYVLSVSNLTYLPGDMRFAAFVDSTVFFTNYVFVFPVGTWILLQADKINLKPIHDVLLVVVTLVLVTAFLGFIFQIHIFRTYPYGGRFGYNGLLQKSITASYFYTAALYFFYLKYKYNPSVTYFLCFLFLVIGALILGTKVIFLSLFLLSIYIFFDQKLYLKKYFYIVCGVLLFLMVTFQNSIKGFVSNQMSSMINFYENSDFITFISSFRNLIFKENYEFYVQKWNFYNYLFGGKFPNYKLFEMSVFDLVIMFGFIGGIYFIWMLKKFIYDPYLSGVNNKLFLTLMLLNLILVSVFSGQLFENNSAVLYVLFFTLLSANEIRQAEKVLKNN